MFIDDLFKIFPLSNPIRRISKYQKIEVQFTFSIDVLSYAKDY